MDERTEKLRLIKEELIAFTGSSLSDERRSQGNHPVIGEGNHYARIMFIGEAPGRNEAKKGRPFCGHAGKILDELLKEVGIKREEVYITNIVKDRPPANRDPLPEEISAYAPYLDRQIAIIKPEIIATLGRFSAHYILLKFGLEEMIQPISALRGKSFKADTRYGPIKIVPFFHPASAIYDKSKKKILSNDFKILKEL